MAIETMITREIEAADRDQSPKAPTKAEIDRMIAELTGKPPQGGSGDGKPDQDGHPKPGETWETEKGGNVKLQPAQEGTAITMGGDEDPPEDKAEIPEQERDPFDFSREVSRDNPHVRGRVRRALKFETGCFGLTRDGRVLGPFMPTATPDQEWCWMCEGEDGDMEVFRKNGTYHHVEGTDSATDILETTSTRKELEDK